MAIAPASATPSTPSLRIVAGDGSSAQPTAGTATSSALGQPNHVAVDSLGDFFIADDVDNVVEEVSSTGNLSIVAGTGAAGSPRRVRRQ